jgi:hypothetical protein
MPLHTVATKFTVTACVPRFCAVNVVVVVWFAFTVAVPFPSWASVTLIVQAAGSVRCRVDSGSAAGGWAKPATIKALATSGEHAAERSPRATRAKSRGMAAVRGEGRDPPRTTRGDGDRPDH